MPPPCFHPDVHIWECPLQLPASIGTRWKMSHLKTFPSAEMIVDLCDLEGA